MSHEGRYKESARPATRALWGVMLLELLIAGIAARATGPAEPNPTEQAVAAVRECMAKSPVPWPDVWRGEYLDTIRQGIASHQDVAQYTKRLEIVRKGFELYWEGLKKGQDRSLFEVHLAQIRWYVESLMSTELPGPAERQKLRDQYKDLAGDAAHLLLTQFPFLDPNVVQTAKADHLAKCHQDIESPLLPIFLHPLLDTQVERIKQRWLGLRYARVDLWRQLGGDAKTSNAKRDMASGDAHPHYLLTQRSLGQLRAQIWAIVAPAPDYYRNAVSKEVEAQKQRVRSRSDARAQEQRLGGAVVQTEYLSFLLAALLETSKIAEDAVGTLRDGKGDQLQGETYEEP